MSTAKSSVIASPRHAAAAAGIGFMPHCVSPEQAASGALADGHSPSASRPHSHPGTPPSAAAGIDAAAAVWDAMPDGKASAPSADPPSEVSGMEVVGGPAADDAAAAAVDNEDEAKVMAEFEAKAAAIEVDKKKEEDKRNQAASETGGAVRPAVVAADHVEIEVPVRPLVAARALTRTSRRTPLLAWWCIWQCRTSRGAVAGRSVCRCRGIRTCSACT